jgi:hypothetical protein
MQTSIKNWVVTYGNGNSCVPALVSEKIKQNTPEIKFEHEGRAFSVEFDSQSDYMAGRDSSIDVPVTIISANRSKRVRGSIFNKKQMHADIQGALEQIDNSYKAFTHKGKRMTKEEVKFVLEWADFYGYKNTGELTDDQVDTALELMVKPVN